MRHWKSFHIERFRRLESLRLEDLGVVNLLVGRNNSGTTSALEALAIASHPMDPFTWLDTGRERELKSARTPALEVLGWFFPHTRPRDNGFAGDARLSGTFIDGGGIQIHAAYREFRQIEIAEVEPAEGDEEPSEFAATLEIDWRRTSPAQLVPDERQCRLEFAGKVYAGTAAGPRVLPCQLISPVSHRTSRHLLAAVDQVLEERLKGQVVDLMRKLAPDVSDIEIRSPQGRGAVIHLFHDGIGHVPLSVEGDGMRRALAFASAASLARNGVLLVDEIETALHPDALAGIFRFLIGVCRDANIQLFVTTHSLEAVDAMLAGMGEDLTDLVAYRLPARGTEHSVKRFGGQTLHDLRNEGGLDLR